MIGGDSPVGYADDARPFLHPFTRYAVTQADVIDATVGVFLGVKVRPGDAARVRVGSVITILFSRSRVDQLVFAATDDLLHCF